MSPANIEKIMKRLQGFFGTAVALTTTALSIYTGLKGIVFFVLLLAGCVIVKLPIYCADL